MIFVQVRKYRCWFILVLSTTNFLWLSYSITSTFPLPGFCTVSSSNKMWKLLHFSSWLFVTVYGRRKKEERKNTGPLISWTRNKVHSQPWSPDNILFLAEEKQLELHCIRCILLPSIIFLSIYPQEGTFPFDHLLLFPICPKVPKCMIELINPEGSLVSSHSESTVFFP